MHLLFEMDNYIVQTKLLKIFGGLWFKDLEDNIVAYFKQKAFKLKEDIARMQTQHAPAIATDQSPSGSDLSATYDVFNLQLVAHRVCSTQIPQIHCKRQLEHRRQWQSIW